MLLIRKRPLTAGVMIRPAIAFTREVYPFRMPEFIAHEIQITIARSRRGKKSGHLMQRHSTIHRNTVGKYAHLFVDRISPQTEYRSLPPDYRLIVTFNIAYCALIVAAIGQLMPQRSHIPVLIRNIEKFKPVVCHPHCQPEVKSAASILYRRTKPRHARNILGNGYRIIFNLMNHTVG